MGAPDSYILSDTNNDSYKAMGDAVALPVASFIAAGNLSHHDRAFQLPLAHMQIRLA